MSCVVILTYFNNIYIMIKRTIIILILSPIFALGQNSFIESNKNTKWISGSKELSFLVPVPNNKNAYKSESSESYIFYIDLDNHNYSTKELKSVRDQCCMCSFTSILNTTDTLIVDYFSTDDFGNSELKVNTFFIQNNKLVQVEVINNENSIITYWER